MPKKRSPIQDTVVRTLRLRLKDKHGGMCKIKAYWVNQVFNYCNELSYKVFQRERRFMSGYDFAPYTKGASKEIPLHSQTIQAISEEYAIRRKQFKKVKLRWRKSSGSNRSLGWIPFKASAISYRNGQLWLSGLDKPLCVWDSYGLCDYELGAGCISEDARGRWYINITVKTKKPPLSQGKADLGIDLGLDDLAAFSDLERKNIEAQQFYRDLEPQLAIAQRANKKAQIKAIHAKIKNRRKDALHKLSTILANEYGAIFIGNVSSTKLVKTNMAKSVLDAGWGMFRTMLQYKGDDAGTWIQIVNEAYSTQDCSVCYTRSGPKGLKGLGIREWTCSHCGTVLDRDRNSALNIVRRGRATLAVGIPVL
jgi:putative transposase